MNKTIDIYIKDSMDVLRLTNDEIAQKKEYKKVMLYLMEHLSDPDVIAKVLKELVYWQQQIIKRLV